MPKACWASKANGTTNLGVRMLLREVINTGRQETSFYANVTRVLTLSCFYVRPFDSFQQNVWATSVPELLDLPVWELWSLTVSGQKKAALGGKKHYLGDKTRFRITGLTWDVCLVICASPD